VSLSVGDILDFKDGHYTVTGDLHHGESDLYLASRSTDAGQYVVKVGDGDETLTLAGLLMGADPKFVPYLPKFASNMMIDGEFATAFEYLDGFYSLADVKQHYPDGVDPRDMAWMFRRLLVVLGFAHKTKYLHGAVLPQHVMIHPDQHGLVLIDWNHSASVDESTDETIDPVGAYKDWYPAEAVTENCGTHTDIYMAANLMSWLMGGDPENVVLPTGIEREYRIFLSSCLSVDWKQRPAEGWGVLKHFDDLIERLYGKRKFRPFHIPPEAP
jgi:hypothetical protein